MWHRAPGSTPETASGGSSAGEPGDQTLVLTAALACRGVLATYYVRGAGWAGTFVVPPSNTYNILNAFSNVQFDHSFMAAQFALVVSAGMSA